MPGHLDARHDLGQPVDTYRTRRRIQAPALWIAAAVGAALAVAAFVAGFDWLGYLLVPLAVAGVVAYARLRPPPGGPRTLRVFDQGLVEASAAGLRAVRWGEIESITPGPAGGMTIVYRTGQLDVDAAGRRRLLEALDLSVLTHSIQRARAELRDRGRAAFGPVVVTSAGLELDGTEQRLPWERLTRVEADADRLVVNTTDANGLIAAWFDGPVPHSSACAALIEEVNPKARRTPTDRPRPEAHPLRKHFVGLAVLALLVPLGYAGYTRAFRPEQRPGSPVAGHADGACGSRRVAFRSAAAREGAGPHPVVAYSEVPDRPEVDGSFPEVPAEWRPQAPALTQLIACVRVDEATTSPGTAVQTCAGEDAFGGGFAAKLTFYQAGYRIDIYEARTGATVGSAYLQPKSAVCPKTWHAYRSTSRVSETTVPVLPTAADYREALRQYVE